MGWKLFTIIYKPQNTTEAKLVQQIENSKKGIEYLKVGKTTYNECMKPKDGFLYIGKYNDFFILNESNMALDFFQEPASKTERFWRTLSRNSQEVYSFILQSVGCMYGFSYVCNQRKIRCKYGYLDEPLSLDIGSPLDIEKEFHKNQNLDYLLEKGELEYHQIGEELVFFFIKKILGESPNQDSKLSQLEMTIYKQEVVDDFDFIYK